MLCGPGGVGKGTVASRLITSVDNLLLSRSWTTRPRRQGEPEGSYIFATEVEFKTKIEEGYFIEWASFLGNFYGTPKPRDSVLGCESHLLLEIDVQGAQQIKERFSNAVLLLLLPPSQDELLRRLTARGDDLLHVEARIGLSNIEIDLARGLGGTEFVNSDLDVTVHEISGFILDRINDCR